MAGPLIGTGWTLTHAVVTDLDNFKATSITFNAREVPRIDTPYMSAPAGPMPILFGDLYREGTVDISGYLDTSYEFKPGDNTNGLLTITARQLPGETAPATYAGDAALVSDAKSAPVEDVCTNDIVFEWKNGYTFTAATAA